MLFVGTSIIHPSTEGVFLLCNILDLLIYSYIDKMLPYLFITTYLLSNGRSAAQRVIEYAGHFKLTQNRSVIESIINIVVSLVCVSKFGIYGVLCGTIAALLYRTNDMILYASKRLLKKSPYKTYIKWGVNAALFVFFVRLFSLIYTKISLNSYFSLILHATVVCLLVIPAFFIAASVVDRESFKYCVEFFKNHMKK